MTLKVSESKSQHDISFDGGIGDGNNDFTISSQ